MLVELRLHEPERQARRDELVDLDLAQEVRERADVILVRVRQHDRPDLAALEVPEVGKDQIDAEMLVSREGESCVDHERLPSVLEDGHVLSDLAETAERDYA